MIVALRFAVFLGGTKGLCRAQNAAASVRQKWVEHENAATEQNRRKQAMKATRAWSQRLHHDEIDATVSRTIVTVLASFGIEEEDRREIRADFEHLRRWRKGVEQAQSHTFKAVITVIVTGFVGAVWLGAIAFLR
jgi:hypothetical protein